MTRSLLVAGIDPGRSGAIALVRWGDGVSIVLDSWAIDGDSKSWPWFERAKAATEELFALAKRNGGLDLIVAEVPGGGGASRKDFRPDTWLSMGRCLGLVEALLRAGAPSAVAMDVTSAEWPKALRVPVGKRSEWGEVKGWHRVIEANTLSDIEGGWPRTPNGLKQAEADRYIAKAEAALIAIAGAILHEQETK